ncbi:MAG: hypothetical protein LIP01_09100 [Tannerellaceae bacterium]|nr:hypothetical protein [Tannerellaceae bacterium]
MTYINQQSGGYKSGTISVIQTAGLQELAQFIKTYATGEFTGSYDNLQHFDRKNTHLFYDFQDYFSYLVPANQQSNPEKLIAECVIYEDHTPTFFEGYPRDNPFDIEKHCGITTYILKDLPEYTDMNEAYKQLAWYKAAYTH